MIYSYGFKNYFGFKEGANVSFALGSRVPNEISIGRDAATILGVKGANGAGKTNLLKALSFIASFSTSSFNSNDDKEIQADSYFSNNEPSEFYIEFSNDNYIYSYELGVTRKSVQYERLFRKSLAKSESSKQTRKVLVFEREGNEVTKRISELGSIDVISLKSNASLISSAFHYKFSAPLDILTDIYLFFNSFITNVGYTGLSDFTSSVQNIHTISEQYSKNEESFKFVKNIIINSDLGISDIKIMDAINENGKKYHFPIFSHKVGEKSHNLTIYDQSSGTKSLFVKLHLYWRALDAGGILILDEFDLNCHPFMLPKLLELFESTETNKHGAQFIFTSHITEVLEKLSKYRTYIVNKEGNECYCYRLDEIGGDILRHGRAISPIYIEGKIGGVPKL